MKQNYFGYVLEHRPTRRKHLIDLRDFLHHFSGYINVQYKSGFRHSDEQILLVRSHRRDVYLFLTTRSQEIVKKIRTTDLSISELHDLLTQHDRLGYASYVMMGRHHFGFASTMFAPRHVAFTHFVDQILETIGLDEYQFVALPFFNLATRDQILQLPFIGRSSIQITRDSGLFDQLRECFSGNVEEYRDVDSIEVTIKPRRRQDIGAAVKKLLRNVPDQGIDKFLLRGREELQEPLVDIYLAGNGVVSDDLLRGSDTDVCEDMIAKANDNPLLRQKLNDHKSDRRFEKAPIATISDFSRADAWAARFGPV